MMYLPSIKCVSEVETKGSVRGNKVYFLTYEGGLNAISTIKV